jgi:carbamoyl-phosphate synthase small subunit
LSREAYLALENGEVFRGLVANPEARGVPVSGELVFNTVHEGYQEVLTDPSYLGQMVLFSYTHLGNYGVVPGDEESPRVWARAVLVKEVSKRPSPRSRAGLLEWLSAQGVPVMVGLDTRALVRRIRSRGSMRAAIAYAPDEAEFLACLEPGTTGQDLVSYASTPRPYSLDASDGANLCFIVYDFGVKLSTLRLLSRLGRVEVVPAATHPQELLARIRKGRLSAGVLLSNGPGDPAAVGYAVRNVRALLGRVPMMGICMGHQILSLALGARTYKLPFGHHGGNHPVREEETLRVFVTSQNHNYAVEEDSLPPDVKVTHRNLNDGVVEGIAAPEKWCFSVQYHPEAGPGPWESRCMFSRFAELVRTFWRENA